MAAISAGILLYRFYNHELQVLFAHPGGPFFKNKDDRSWTIPKGLPTEGESLENAAVREFEEETGIKINNNLVELGSIKQKGGKIVYAWAVKGDLPLDFKLKSNNFEINWPPRSTHKMSFPEIDRVEFFSLPEARKKIIKEQIPFIDRLKKLLNNEIK